MNIYQHWYHPEINIKITDVLVILLLYVAIIVYGSIRQKRRNNEPAYKYYKNALVVRLTMSIVFAMVVMLFYPGDSMVYYQNVNCLNKMLFTNSGHYFDILLNGNRAEYWSYFTYETGYPEFYMWRDPNAIFVSRIYSPFMLLTYRSFLLSTIIAGFIGFTGIWQLFKTFCNIYPGLEKQFVAAIIYFPSVIFWSSGIMKDTLTLSAIGGIVYSFYNFAILYKFRIKYIVVIIICSIIIINIKSYIFAALLPGLLVWLFFKQLSSIKSGLMKFVIAPILGIIVIGGFALLMSNLSGEMGAYGEVDKSLEQAKIIQEDLKRAEQYGENYYDIGEFEATPTGVLSKAPIAIISGIFRPFIWEARNPFVLLAALESLFMMGMLLFTFFKAGIIKSFRNVLQDPMLIFAFSFTIIFAFGVGLATANFGALVRYKIPMLPFFVGGLFVLMEKGKKKVSG